MEDNQLILMAIRPIGFAPGWLHKDGYRLQAESFPLSRYTVGMYPPIVSTAQVRALIRELTVAGRPPSGAALRRELKSRFGASGGVSRIYRILAADRAPASLEPEAGEFEALKRELALMRERAERAEASEADQQSHWMMEVDRLRMRLQALGPETAQGRRDIAAATLLRHQLQAAELRAARLEEQVIALLRRQPQ